MTTTTAISAVTAAASSSAITVAAGAQIQAYTMATLATGEKVHLEHSHDGSAWHPTLTAGGPVILYPTTNRVSIAGPGTFRLVKSATAAAVAVYYDS